MNIHKYCIIWWNRHGWTALICGSIIIIFLLWIFNSGKANASSTTNMQNAMNVMFGSNLSSNYENTKLIMDRLHEKKEETDFVYEAGASKGENECRRIMQDITGMKFYKIRPDFLKNPVTGVFLELDCYCEALRLAVEYNGAQHDKYNKFMHQGSMDKFRNQQYRDYIKKTLCKEHGVYLIVVPHTVKLSELRPYLIKHLEPYLEQRLQSDVKEIM